MTMPTTASSAGKLDLDPATVRKARSLARVPLGWLRDPSTVNVSGVPSLCVAKGRPSRHSSSQPSVS